MLRAEMEKAIVRLRFKKAWGVGVITFVLLVALIAIVSIGVFKHFGAQVQSTIAGLARELAPHSVYNAAAQEVSPICSPGVDDVYDPRAERYRSRSTGRFTRPSGC